MEALEYHPIDAYLALALNRTGPAVAQVYRGAFRYILLVSSDQDSWSLALDKLLPSVPQHLLQELLDLARKYLGPFAWRSILSEMARKAPTADLDSVLATAAEVLSDPIARSVVLAVIAERGPEDLLLSLLAASATIPCASVRTQVLQPLVARLAAVLSATPTVTVPHLDACLAAVRHISEHGRPGLLKSLRDLLPWLHTLGTGAATEDILLTLFNVGSRWE